MDALTLDAILDNLDWYSNFRLAIFIYSPKIYKKQVLVGLREEKQIQEEDM